MNMRLRFLFALILMASLNIAMLFAQQTPNDTPPKPEKKKSIQEQIKDYEDYKKKALARIEVIDATLEPAKDKIAFKLFEISPEEYAILRLEAQTTDSANKFFSARSTEVTLSQENIATFFDEAYQAIKSGFLLYGQEQNLVKQDVDLYNRIQEAIKNALLQSEKGADYQALYDEKQKIISDLKDVDPVLLYHMQRKNWFKSFPELKQTLENAVTEKKAAQ